MKHFTNDTKKNNMVSVLLVSFGSDKLEKILLLIQFWI